LKIIEMKKRKFLDGYRVKKIETLFPPSKTRGGP